MRSGYQKGLERGLREAAGGRVKRVSEDGERPKSAEIFERGCRFWWAGWKSGAGVSAVGGNAAL